MTRVLVIDDSAVVRSVLSRELSKAALDVVGVASNPFAARDLILRLKPEVLTLDLEMPRMDGLSFLERLMAFHPMPVAVISSLSPSGSEAALRALELGALEVFEKPSFQSRDELARFVGQVLAPFLRQAALARPRPRLAPAQLHPPASARARVIERTSDKLVAVGASTGGTEALAELLQGMPADHPGVLVVQHMPPLFTKKFAERLDARCRMHVREARSGDRVSDGLALIAPGNQHMVLHRSGAHYGVECRDGLPVNHMRPSVDVLFHSVAAAAGPNALGVLLTGMGRDGAEGLLAMLNSGAVTLAQDEASCVVYGMPKEAVRIGAVQESLPLHNILGAISRNLVKMKKASLAGKIS